MGRVAVPKTGQKPPLCHAGLALEYLWAGWSCRRQVRSPFRHAGLALEHLWAGWPCRRQARAAERGRSWNALPRQVGSGAPVGRVDVPKQIVRRIIMIEVKVLVGYTPWQMVSVGIGSRKEGAHAVGRPSRQICHGAIMDRLFLRRRHRLPKRGT